MNTAEPTIQTTVDLSEFKNRCLEILEHLTAPGIILTNEGRPVAKITPLPSVNNEELIGSMKGEISINGDIFSTGIQWDAQS